MLRKLLLTLTSPLIVANFVLKLPIAVVTFIFIRIVLNGVQMGRRLEYKYKMKEQGK